MPRTARSWRIPACARDRTPPTRPMLSRRRRTTARVDGGAHDGVPVQVADGVPVPALPGVAGPVAGDGLGVEVEERHRELHAPDPVGQGVVHLHHDGRPAAIQPFDQGELPQGARPVEAAHGRERGQLEHLVAAVRRGDGGPAQVPGHVEVLIGGPPWCGQVTGDLDQPLAERGNLAGRPLHPPHEIRPGGSALEPGDRHHGRAQFGVALHVPGEGVVLAHERRRSHPSSYPPQRPGDQGRRSPCPGPPAAPGRIGGRPGLSRAGRGGPPARPGRPPPRSRGNPRRRSGPPGR